MNVTLGVMAIIIIPMRLIFKRWFSYRQCLTPDDWVILATLIFGVPCTIINYVGLIGHGLGKDVWTLDPNQITEFVKYFYIMEILYLLEMALIKLSLSLFYLYIFPGLIIRRVLLGTVAFNGIIGVTFVTIAVFQCTPVRYYWSQYVVDNAKGQCIDINAFGWGNAAINLAVDIWMIIIPMVQIRKLHLHWKKKIGVAIMFMTGAL